MSPLYLKIAPCAFVDDGVYLTLAGNCGIAIRLAPQDSECMDALDMNAVTKRFEAAQRLLEAGTRIYEYLCKREPEPGQYTFETWMVLERPGADARALRSIAESFVVQLMETTPGRIADRQEAYRLLRSLLNYDHDLLSVPLKYDDLLGYFASDSPVSVEDRGLLLVGGHYTRVLTLKDPPQGTVPDLLRPLREIPGECLIAIEWKVLDMQWVKAEIRSKTGHFHRSKYVPNWVSSASSKLTGNQQDERPEHMQQDESATAMESQLGKLIADIETNGTTVGEFALTVIVFSRDRAEVDRMASAAFKALAGREAILYQERHNALGAWFAALPGGHSDQIRSMYLTNRNFADFSLLFSPATGNKRNEHLNAECLAVLRTRQESQYHLNLHYGDVFHTGFIGQTGSGKSYSARWLLSQAIERYGAIVTIFDIGGSYRTLVDKYAGAYASLGLNNAFTMAPFSLALTPEHLVFLHAFVNILMRSNGYTLERATDDATIEKAIRNLYLCPEAERRLGNLELPDYLAPYLDKWRGTGRYASVFDNAYDTLTTNNLQAFDFEGLDAFVEVIEPFLFYVFHRVSTGIDEDPTRLKILMVDECWKFLTNESAKRYIRGAFKTFRKKNTGIWIATQSLEDLARAGMDETVTENCGSLIFLPNPRMDAEKYKKAFHLNETEVSAVLNMQPKCEWLLKRPDASKILRLVA